MGSRISQPETHNNYPYNDYEQKQDQKAAKKLNDALNLLNCTHGSNSVWVIGLTSYNETLIHHTRADARTEKFRQLSMCRWSQKIRNIDTIFYGRRFRIYSATNKERDMVIIIGYLRENKPLFPDCIADICLCYYHIHEFYAGGMNDFAQVSVPYTDAYNVFTKIKPPTNNISKICSGSYGYTCFWITYDGSLYAHGNNNMNQFGIAHFSKTKTHKPIKIEFFTDKKLVVIDAASSHTFNIVLCDNGTVWFAGVFSYGGIGYKNKDDANNGWIQVIELQTHFIVSVKVSERTAFFMDNNGNVWCCGWNCYGQLGNGVSHTALENRNVCPSKIKYFEENDIKIVKIECGNIHNMALDMNGKVYCWGYDENGSCGIGNYKDRKSIFRHVVPTPTLVESLKDKFVIDIRSCESQMSGAITKNGEFYVWGSSLRGCLFSKSPVYYPKCINKLVYDVTGCEKIMDMVFGAEAVFFLVKNAQHESIS
eukprot:233353_1